jgi:hypothetical protein
MSAPELSLDTMFVALLLNLTRNNLKIQKEKRET